MQLRQGDASEAAASLERALQCATPDTSSDQRLRLMSDYAFALVTKEEYEKALTKYQELYRLGLDYAR